MGASGTKRKATPRRGGRHTGRFVAVVGCAGIIVIGAGTLAYASIPPSVPLAMDGPATFAPTVLDAASGVVAKQLSVASGLTLETLAASVPAVSTPTAEKPPTVAGEQAATTEYADTLAALDAAEKAAAEQLALSEADAKQAKIDQKKAEVDLASEEAAAAREIDDAVAAAIAAAEAQSQAAPPMGTDPAAGTSDPVPAPAGQAGTGGGAVPSSSAAGTAQVLALVKKYFPAEEVTNAMAVSRCESGHRNAVGAANGNGTRDYGVFQINDGGTLQAALRRIGLPYSDVSDARTKALNAELNVRMARVLWDSRGWQPWVCAARVKVVSGLYQRSPGPMYGKYNESGQAG